MAQIVNHIVHVIKMGMVIVKLEVTGANVILDGKDGVVTKSVPVENMDMIAK